LEEFNATVKEACTIELLSCALALAVDDILLSSLAAAGTLLLAEVLAEMPPEVADTGVAMISLLMRGILE
jgi:hypothetical protein